MSETGDSLRRQLEIEVRRGATPGAAWWVGDARGPIASGACGHAALAPVAVPLRLDTPFDLASVTKPVATALLALMLEREQALNLDARLDSIFPELSASPVGSASLRDAALHRAGFPAWAPLYLSGSTPEAYLTAIARLPRAVAPGETLYSDMGYLLLGFAVERAAGAPLDRLFAQRIARPLGLTRCGFAGRTGDFQDAAATESSRSFEQAMAGPEARCDQVLTQVGRGQVHDGNAWGLGGIAGHAGLFGQAAEVAAVALSLLDPVRLGLDDGDLDAMMRPGREGGARTIGFLRAKDSDSVRDVLPDDAVGHWGFTGTSLWIDPARSRVYVLLTNRIHPRVPREPFTATRRAFHQLASALP